jgi:uncharacterized protein DUF2000
MTGTGPVTPTHSDASTRTAASAALRVVLGLPIGAAGVDASGTTVVGSITTSVPVRVADGATLTEVFGKADVDQSLQVACLPEVARRARTYGTYLNDLTITQNADTDLVALCVAAHATV